jgi:hypothetical protein
MNKLNIGDKVIVRNNWNMTNYCQYENPKEQYTGTISVVEEDESLVEENPMAYDVDYLIVFDEYIGGHNGNGVGLNGYCWWVKSDEVIPMETFTPIKYLKRHLIC